MLRLASVSSVEEGVEVVAEELAGSAEAAALAEGRVEQSLAARSTATGGEVVADEAEPVELLVGEGAAGLLLLEEPGVEPFVDLLGVRDQLVVLAEGVAARARRCW